MSKLTVSARDMASQENCDGEEYDMIVQLSDRVDELERRIALALELRYANMPGFVEDALAGKNVEAANLGIGTLREYLDTFERNGR